MACDAPEEDCIEFDEGEECLAYSLEDEAEVDAEFEVADEFVSPEDPAGRFGNCTPPRYVPQVLTYTTPHLTSCNVPLNGSNRWLTSQQIDDYCWMVKDGNGAKDTGSCQSPFLGQCAGYTYGCPAGWSLDHVWGNAGNWDCSKSVFPPCLPGEIREGNWCVSTIYDPECPLY